MLARRFGVCVDARTLGQCMSPLAYSGSRANLDHPEAIIAVAGLAYRPLDIWLRHSFLGPHLRRSLASALWSGAHLAGRPVVRSRPRRGVRPGLWPRSIIHVDGLDGPKRGHLIPSTPPETADGPFARRLAVRSPGRGSPATSSRGGAHAAHPPRSPALKTPGASGSSQGLRAGSAY